MANLFRQVTVVALLSVGMTLVIVSGNIDLSVGSALGMFGAITASMITNMHVNSYLAVIIILLLGFIVGCIHGALIHYLNIPSFVVTLGGLIAYRGVTQYVARASIPLRTGWIKAISIESIPGAGGFIIVTLVIIILIINLFKQRASNEKLGLTSNPLWVEIVKLTVLSLFVIIFASVMALDKGIPIQVIIMFAVAFIVSWVVKYIRFGHYVYAIGGNKQAAFYSGIPLGMTIVGVFGLIGFLSALAGIITISELSSAAPDVGELKELETIAACVIGGTSLMGGNGVIGMSILGALIMASIKNGMSMMGVAAQMQKVILGSLLVIAVGLDQWSRRTKK